jgi:hypothetical protein
MWNLVHMGYMPLKLVLGTAVYSLGVVGGIKALFKSFTRGEIPELTSLIYDAREHAIGLIRDEAAPSAPTTSSASRPTSTSTATCWSSWPSAPP